MNFFKLLLVCSLLLWFQSSSFAQDNTLKFGSDIYVYNAIGFDLNKRPNKVLVKQRGLRIMDRDTCFHIRSDHEDDQFVVMGELHNGDTINRTRYDFKFMPTPDPKVHWKAMENFQLGDRNAIGLHRDSLGYLKEFNVWIPNEHLSHLPFEIVNTTMYCQGWKGAPISFANSNMLPDSFIDSLANFGDTIGISMTTFPFVVWMASQDKLVPQRF